MSRKQLAQQLRENFATRIFHGGLCNSWDDTDLTNLGWLQNMNPLNMAAPLQSDAAAAAASSELGSAQLSSDSATQRRQVAASNAFQRTFSTPASVTSFMNEQQLQQQQQQLHDLQHQQQMIQLPACAAHSVPPSPSPEFALDASRRPPYSFTSLIYMAMANHQRSKMTLQEICDWIQQTFAFYRESSDKGWQSAVRYNLTLNRCFQRVPRRKDEAGNKGGHWRLNADHIASSGMAELSLLPGHTTQPTGQGSRSSLSEAKRGWQPTTVAEATTPTKRCRPLVQSQLSEPSNMLDGHWLRQQQQEQSVFPQPQQVESHDPTLSSFSTADMKNLQCSNSSDLAETTDCTWQQEQQQQQQQQQELQQQQQSHDALSDGALQADSLLDLTLHGTALSAPSWWPTATAAGSEQQQQQQQQFWLDAASLDISELDSLLGAS